MPQPPEPHPTHQPAAIPPEPVRAAIADWCRGRTEPPLSPVLIERGDVRVVVPTDGYGDHRRIALVIATGEFDGVATVLLAHSCPEMATSADAVIGTAGRGIPYLVVVQTDLGGCVWESQIGRRVGHIDPASVQAAISCTYGDITKDVTTGPPLTGVADRRWAFKAAEGRVLRGLTADATAALLDRFG